MDIKRSGTDPSRQGAARMVHRHRANYSGRGASYLSLKIEKTVKHFSAHRRW